MIALDTNVLVRFLTRDEPAQAERARKLVEQNEVWLSKTVLLEAEWVLRFSYGFGPDRIQRALQAFLGLSGVQVEDSGQVALALEWHAAGLDFADALHLASAESAAAGFSTFDQKLLKNAARVKTVLRVGSP